MIEIKTTGYFFTNSYILSNDKNECIIIDPGLDYKNVANYIKNKYDVKAILLTHGHMDHIDGIQYFLDTPIYMTKETKEMVYDSYESIYDTVGRSTPYSYGMLNEVIINDGDILSLIGFNIKVIKTPGHTSGSCVFILDNIMFSGDTIFYHSYGRTDMPTGNQNQIFKSILNILNTFSDDMIIYPGHGNETTIKEEKKYY